MNTREIVKLSLTAFDDELLDAICLETLIDEVGIERVARVITIYPDKAKFQYDEIPEDYRVLIDETIKELRRILII